MQLRLRGFLIVRETVKEMQYCSWLSTHYTSWTLVLVAGEHADRRAATDVMRLVYNVKNSIAHSLY